MHSPKKTEILDPIKTIKIAEKGIYSRNIN